MTTRTEPADAGNEPFNVVIRRRRRSLGLHQDELADLAGVSERFVNSLENGKRTVQLDKVLAVLSTLGLHLELHPGSAGEIRSGADQVTR